MQLSLDLRAVGERSYFPTVEEQRVAWEAACEPWQGLTIIIHTPK